MKILIDIPKEFEVDYNTDRFAEFFQRCRADMGVCCGKYEHETSEMLEKAFTESRPYDPDKVVEQMLAASFERYGNEGMGGQKVVALDDVIEIVKAGVADDK